MKRKTRLLVELLVVTGVLTVALFWVLPSFVRVQRGHCLVEILENADSLLTAEMLYRLDGGTLERSFANPNKTSLYEKIDPEPLGRAYFRCTLDTDEQRKERLENHYRMLMDNGYLDEPPDFSIVDMENSIVKNDDLAFVILSKPVYGKNTDTRFRALKCYFSLFNPRASRENQEAFMDALNMTRFNKRPHSVGLYEPMVSPADFYDPSNGVDSAGYIYIDNFGNHSPFGKETPQLSILELQERIRGE